MYETMTAEEYQKTIVKLALEEEVGDQEFQDEVDRLDQLEIDKLKK